MSLPGVQAPGASASSSAATGPQRSGDIGASTFKFGGIQTGGSQGGVGTWLTVAVIALAAVLVLVMLKRR